MSRSAAARRVAPAAAQTDRAAPLVDPGDLPSARRAALPKEVEPALATLVDAPPEGDEWLHEMKLDGYRILCRVQRGKARLLTRSGQDWTARFPAIARAVAALPVQGALIDGELAAVLPSGKTSFHALQATLSGKPEGQLVYFAFDLLHLDGHDITAAPLEDRKRALAGVLAAADSGPLRYSDHVEGPGAALLANACKLGLEGLVSKRRDAPYTPGRSRAWVKSKCQKQQELVVGGYTLSDARAGLRSLLLGVYQDGPQGGELRYAGKVGAGFSAHDLATLRERLERLEQRESPYAERVREPASRVRWVRPEIVVEVSFTEWTNDGRLRHPTFLGLREDKPAREIRREEPREDKPAAKASRTNTAKTASTTEPAKTSRAAKPAAPEKPAKASKAAKPATPAAEEAPPEQQTGANKGRVVVAGVAISHPERVLYPGQGATKLDLARYYEAIAPWILPHVADRPTTLVRCPEGLSEPCFYQKHTGYYAPSTLRRVHIQEKTKVGQYLIADTLPGLIGLVQIGILEIHTWNSHVATLEQPDQLVFDLDPDPSVPWSRVVSAAQLIRKKLEDLDLESFVKTTGGKGLHVVAPVRPGPDWDEFAAFARAIAEGIAGEDPGGFTANMSKARRKGRIFLDYLRNVRGATAVAAYSTRARPGAPVAMPIGWDELEAGIQPADFNIATAPARLRALRKDPWARFFEVKQAIPAAALRALRRR